ncbi:protein FAF-like, chloroplastic [Papaver somniferum]|uniref:protein FAF-like, chloroplastic n=1 Tax=Papaver somniferum TaxID=3469 RepID=UPI000E70576E|nr:protein FAF-like, chloroplastic [Papaver somniferum]
MSSVNQVQGFECEKPEYITSTTSSGSATLMRRTLSAVDMFSKVADQYVEPKNDYSQKPQQPGQFDIWCSILIQKPSSLPPPYVHPLVKQSKSCLSLKSLEICTENLGSESGSDGYPHSDISLSDTEEEDEDIQEVEEESIEQVVVEEKKELAVIMNYSKKSSSPPPSVRRSFPPPLKSLSNFPPPLKSLSKPGGGGIQMKTHRQDGRLILEAVSVPTSTNCFNAQRRDGRLVLTFSSPIQESIKNQENSFETDEEVEFGCCHDDEIEQYQEEEPITEEEEDKTIVLEMTSARVPKLPTGVINVHRSALMANKFTGLTNNRNNWSSSSNLENKIEKTMNSPSTKLVPQSLPISPPKLAARAPRMSASRLVPEKETVAATAAVEPTFNRYEYCWRKDTSSVVPVSGIHHLLDQQQNSKNTYHNNYNSNNLTSCKNNYYTNSNSNNLLPSTTKGVSDYKEEKQKPNGNGKKQQVVEHLIVPAYCKPEPRRSLVFWEPPHCITTS